LEQVWKEGYLECKKIVIPAEAGIQGTHL